MAFRLFKKSILMVLREKKQFTVFCLMYTVLIFWTSYSIELVINTEGPGLGFESTSFFIALGVGIILSLLYSWIIVRRNSKTIATLKCIGWTNRDLNSLISGFILFTTIMGFLIVIEVLFHYAAIFVYLQGESSLLLGKDIPLVGLLPVFATFFIFLVFQILAILVANRKVLKVRPIIALKRVGE